MSEPERLYIETQYYDQVTREWEKEAETYELWHQIYPQEPGPQHNLPSLYAMLGQFDRALRVGQAILPQQPDNEDTYA